MANGSILTSSGKKIILNRAYKASPDYTAPTVFKVGISNGTPSVADTDLDNPIAITGTEAVDDCEATTGWTDSADMNTATSTTQVKEGTNSLSLEKNGAGSATYSTAKTTTSRVFTSKTLFVWLYITAVADLVATGTDAVTIRFGSDAGGANHYYQKGWDISELAAGWNLLYFTSASADSTVGSPNLSAMIYSYIALTCDNAADLIAVNRIMMDDWKLASTDDFTKTYVSGYPTINETTLEVEIRCQLLSTEANGYDLNGFGLFNTDGTVLMHSEDTFTAESKSNTDQFTFIVKDRLT
jgi:hypothetical protein